MIVDLFAGGGGASRGIEQALGQSVDVAVNHDAHAIAMHAENHPDSLHFQEDVWAVDPQAATGGLPVDLLWASPDCRHFSRAKGGKPVSPKIRSLAWVVTKWARAVRPAVICLENVAEFQTWGPLLGGMPDKDRQGETFARWVGQLNRLGYVVRWKILNAADFGAPTSRKRLFLVARRDGIEPIWPEPTHGPGRPFPYRTAAECIDWSIPCPSIFGRKKPLADATLRRIAHGVMRYVVNAKKPFLVNLTHGGRLEDIDQPMNTVTGAHRGEKALVSAFLAKHFTGVIGQGLDAPLGTVTAIDHHSLVCAHISRMFGNSVGNPLDAPLGATTAGGGGKSALVAANLIKLYGTSNGAPVSEPVPTVTGQGQHLGLVAAFLAKYYGTANGQKIDAPLDTVTTKGRFGLVTVNIEGEPHYIADIGMRMLQPRELARAQGFPDSYVLTGTKTQQVARIGNSVCPDVAEALVRAQFPTNAALRDVA